MKPSTKYSSAAVACALIMALAYLIANRFEYAGFSVFQRDNWTGKIYAPTPETSAQLVPIPFE